MLLTMWLHEEEEKTFGEKKKKTVGAQGGVKNSIAYNNNVVCLLSDSPTIIGSLKLHKICKCYDKQTAHLPIFQILEDVW